MGPGGQGVQFGLDAHRPHLFPDLDGIHRGPAVGVPVDEEHGRRVEIEGEFRREYGIILIASLGVVRVDSVRQRIGGIDADAPLNLAGQFVQRVDR